MAAVGIDGSNTRTFWTWSKGSPGGAAGAAATGPASSPVRTRATSPVRTPARDHDVVGLRMPEISRLGPDCARGDRTGSGLGVPNHVPAERRHRAHPAGGRLLGVADVDLRVLERDVLDGTVGVGRVSQETGHDEHVLEVDGEVLGRTGPAAGDGQ